MAERSPSDLFSWLYVDNYIKVIHNTLLERILWNSLNPHLFHDNEIFTVVLCRRTLRTCTWVKRRISFIRKWFAKWIKSSGLLEPLPQGSALKLPVPSSLYDTSPSVFRYSRRQSSSPALLDDTTTGSPVYVCLTKSVLSGPERNSLPSATFHASDFTKDAFYQRACDFFFCRFCVLFTHSHTHILTKGYVVQWDFSGSREMYFALTSPVNFQRPFI